MHIGEAEVAAVVAEGEFLVVQAELVEDRRVQVVHVDFVLDREVAEVVGLAIREAGFEAAASEQHGKTRGVMVAARAVFLGVGRAAKLAAPPHDRVFEQPARLQIAEEAGDGFVDAHGMVLVLRQIGVLVPRGIVRVVGVVDLDETHAALREASRHETLATVVFGRLLADAVERERRRRFLRKIERIGRVVLQAPRELVGIRDGLEFVVAGLCAELLLVHRAHEIELPLLFRRREARIAHVAETGLDRLLAGAPDRGALKNRREKRAAVVAWAAVRERRAERDEGRQVLTLRAQTIRNPRTHRGADEIRGAGVEKQRRRPVRHALGVHRTHDAVVVGEFGHVGKQLRDPAPALPTLLEVPHRLHHATGRAHAGLRDRALVEKLHHFAVIRVERGLVVEAVEVAHSAAHEEKNHALRPRRKMSRMRRERVRLAPRRRLRGHARKCHVAETARELLQRLPARKNGIGIRGHGVIG